MKLHKKSDRIKTVAERYKTIYCINGKWRECYSGLLKDYEKHYELLKRAKAEKEIANIIGNSSWTANRCSECGKDSDVLVEVGENSDCESVTAYLCSACIKRAFEFIGE